MSVIIDLSCTICAHPVSRVLDAFTNLCDSYAQPGSCTPSFLQCTANNLWVYFQYIKHEQTLIRDYRLGKISTSAFLDKLHEIFSFLDDQALMFGIKTKTDILKSQEDYLCLRDKLPSALTHKDFALAMLEKAWNSMVDIQPLNLYQFSYVQTASLEEPVYLTCNSNELHVDKLIRTLQKELPSDDYFFNWHPQTISKPGMLELAPNLYLVSSHLMQRFKTQRDDHSPSQRAHDYLEPLIRSLKKDNQPIKVVSKPYSNLNLRAKQLGIPEHQLLSSDDYFPKALPRKKWR